MLYFDHAASTQMSPAALQTYQEVAQNFYANSDSLHQAGNTAGQLIQETKNQLAQLFKLATDGFVFTSGGTQANQLGITALVQGRPQKEILVSPLEHASVYQILDKLQQTQGYRIQKLPVDNHGHVTIPILTKYLSADTNLVIIQGTNAITGICQNISDLAAYLQASDVPLFVDAVQSVTKVPLDLTQVAGFSVSAHKFNGPKGCGFLYLNPKYLTQPLFQHVFQQNGFLPGTLDTPGILSMLTALTQNNAQQAQNLVYYQTLKQTLYDAIKPTIEPIAPWARFSGICGLLLPHTPGQEAATFLGQQGFCFSTVSACSLRDPRPDATLTSLGLTPEMSERYIRLSFGAENTVTQVQQLAQALNQYYG